MEGVELSLNKARDSFTVVNPPSALDLLPQTARSPSLQTRSDTSPTDVEEPSSHVSSSTPSNQPSTDPLLQEPLPTQEWKSFVALVSVGKFPEPAASSTSGQLVSSISTPNGLGSSEVDQGTSPLKQSQSFAPISAVPSHTAEQLGESLVSAASTMDLSQEDKGPAFSLANCDPVAVVANLGSKKRFTVLNYNQVVSDAQKVPGATVLTSTPADDPELTEGSPTSGDDSSPSQSNSPVPPQISVIPAFAARWLAKKLEADARASLHKKLTAAAAALTAPKPGESPVEAATGEGEEEPEASSTPSRKRKGSAKVKRKKKSSVKGSASPGPSSSAAASAAAAAGADSIEDDDNARPDESPDDGPDAYYLLVNWPESRDWIDLCPVRIHAGVLLKPKVIDEAAANDTSNNASSGRKKAGKGKKSIGRKAAAAMTGALNAVKDAVGLDDDKPEAPAAPPAVVPPILSAWFESLKADAEEDSFHGILRTMDWLELDVDSKDVSESLASICYQAFSRRTGYMNWVGSANGLVEVPEAIPGDEVDMRAYNRTLEGVHPDRVSVPIMMHAMLEQVVKLTRGVDIETAEKKAEAADELAGLLGSVRGGLTTNTYLAAGAGSWSNNSTPHVARRHVSRGDSSSSLDLGTEAWTSRPTVVDMGDDIGVRAALAPPQTNFSPISEAPVLDVAEIERKMWGLVAVPGMDSWQPEGSETAPEERKRTLAEMAYFTEQSPEAVERTLLSMEFEDMLADSPEGGELDIMPSDRGWIRPYTSTALPQVLREATASRPCVASTYYNDQDVVLTATYEPVPWSRESIGSWEAGIPALADYSDWKSTEGERDSHLASGLSASTSSSTELYTVSAKRAEVKEKEWTLYPADGATIRTRRGGGWVRTTVGYRSGPLFSLVNNESGEGSAELTAPGSDGLVLSATREGIRLAATDGLVVQMSTSGIVHQVKNAGRAENEEAARVVFGHGSVVKYFAEGRREVLFANGDRGLISAEGQWEMITDESEGSQVASVTDPETGVVVHTRHDMVMRVEAPDGHEEVHHPDGTVIDSQESGVSVSGPGFAHVVLDASGAVHVDLRDGCKLSWDPETGDVDVSRGDGWIFSLTKRGILTLVRDGESKELSALEGRWTTGYKLDLNTAVLNASDPSGNSFHVPTDGNAVARLALSEDVGERVPPSASHEPRLFVLRRDNSGYELVTGREIARVQREAAANPRAVVSEGAPGGSLSVVRTLAHPKQAHEVKLPAIVQRRTAVEVSRALQAPVVQMESIEAIRVLNDDEFEAFEDGLEKYDDWKDAGGGEDANEDSDKKQVLDPVEQGIARRLAAMAEEGVSAVASGGVGKDAELANLSRVVAVGAQRRISVAIDLETLSRNESAPRLSRVVTPYASPNGSPTSATNSDGNEDEEVSVEEERSKDTRRIAERAEELKAHYFASEQGQGFLNDLNRSLVIRKAEGGARVERARGQVEEIAEEQDADLPPSAFRGAEGRTGGVEAMTEALMGPSISTVDHESTIPGGLNPPEPVGATGSKLGATAGANRFAADDDSDTEDDSAPGNDPETIQEPTPPILLGWEDKNKSKSVSRTGSGSNRDRGATRRSVVIGTSTKTGKVTRRSVAVGVPNERYTTIEGVRWKDVKAGSIPNGERGSLAASMRSARASVGTGFQVSPAQVEFGSLPQGVAVVYRGSFWLTNVGTAVGRFKLRAKPWLKFAYTPGPVAPGMKVRVEVEVNGTGRPTGLWEDSVEVVTEREVFTVGLRGVFVSRADWNSDEMKPAKGVRALAMERKSSATGARRLSSASGSARVA